MNNVKLFPTNHRVNEQELVDRKAAIMAKLSELFARIDGHVQPISALAQLSTSGKSAGQFHVDCMLILGDATYYFSFGYARAKEDSHPFFIRLLDQWFDGSKLIAREAWLFPALKEAMNSQGLMKREQMLSVSLTELELAAAA